MLAHLDIKTKHNAGKHLNLTDYLSRYPIAKPKPFENYDEEYVINCVIPSLEFINTQDSITDEKRAAVANGRNNNTADKPPITNKKSEHTAIQ